MECVPLERLALSGPILVSLVTPSFNQARYLQRTIESVLHQSYPHLQYIVMDGGSTDGSREILESYQDQIDWFSEPDRGQAHAINKGLHRARGQILGYLNSDDVLAPGAIDKVVAHFQAHPDWDLVYGRALLIDDQDRVLGQYRTQPFTLERLATEACICQPAAFWRADLTRRIGLFDEQLHYCLDYDYWLRAAGAGARLVHVEDLLAAARRHDSAKSTTSKLAMYRESIRVCRRHRGQGALGQYLGLWQQWCADTGRHWLGRRRWLLGWLAQAQQWWESGSVSLALGQPRS